MIKQLSLNNFRGHNKTVSFGPTVNYLTGPNEAGKTSIKEAIAFIFFGTDSKGAKNPDHFISVGQESCTVALQTPKAVISRKKKRGATSEIKIERDGLPVVRPNQTEMSVQIKLSLEAFSSCWNVGYFMDLPQDKRLKVLGEIANVDRRDLLQKMLPLGTSVPANVKFIDLKHDADAVAMDRRKVQNMVASDEGMLSQLSAQLATFETHAGVDIDALQRAVNDLQIQADSFESYKRLAENYRVAAASFKAAKQVKEEADAKFSEVKESVGTLSGYVADTNVALEKETRRESEASARINESSQLRKAMPTPPMKPGQTEGTCATCGQAVTGEYLGRVLEEYNRILLAYNAEASKVSDYNRSVDEGIKAAIAERDDARQKIKNLQKVLFDKKTQLSGLEQTLRIYEATLTKQMPPEPVAPTKPEGDERAIREQLVSESAKLQAGRMYNSQREGTLRQISLVKTTIDKRKAQITEFSLIEDALKKLPEVETAKTLEIIKIPGVSIQLVNGELVVASEATGVDYRSLSTGRRHKIDLSLCAGLRRHAGPQAPSWIFVDDADLMDEYLDLIPRDVQVLVARVDASKKELEVLQIETL